MTNKIKIRVRISTNKVGSECTDEIEIDREDWDVMSDDEREEMCKEAAFNYLEWGWEEVQ